jgi:ribose 5-phosphate isomerase A
MCQWRIFLHGVELPEQNGQDRLKAIVGRAGADMVRDGNIVGLVTGSTARFAIDRLGERTREGLRILAIPTSTESEKLALELGIPLTTLDEHPDVDITIDGADEVDPNLDLIKGLGGALLREKMVAHATGNEVIVVDSSKLVDRLGTRSPLPVEVTKYGHSAVARRLAALGCQPTLRKVKVGGEGTFITDNGNCIYDCRFPGIPDARALEASIDSIPGVVECGLFIGLARVVITASVRGLEVRRRI